MVEQNNENLNSLNEDKTEMEVSEKRTNIIEEILDNNEEIKESIQRANKKRSPFWDSVIDNLTNAVISLGISAVIMLLVDLILRPMGYHVANKSAIMIIAFFIVVVFFKPVLGKIKDNKTAKEQ